MMICVHSLHGALWYVPAQPAPYRWQDCFFLFCGIYYVDTCMLQGKCDSPPGGTLATTLEAIAARIGDAEPWAAPRCVVLTSEDLIVVMRSRLWLDALHIQITESTDSGVLAAVSPQYFGRLYLANSVVQGDRESAAAPALVRKNVGGLYAQGVLPAECVPVCLYQVMLVLPWVSQISTLIRLDRVATNWYLF